MSWVVLVGGGFFLSARAVTQEISSRKKKNVQVRKINSLSRTISRRAQDGRVDPCVEDVASDTSLNCRVHVPNVHRAPPFLVPSGGTCCAFTQEKTKKKNKTKSHQTSRVGGKPKGKKKKKGAFPLFNLFLFVFLSQSPRRQSPSQ